MQKSFDSGQPARTAQADLNRYFFADKCKLNLYPTTKNFRPVQIESICRRQNNCIPKIEILVGKSRKHCGKKEKILVTKLNVSQKLKF